MPSSFSVNVVTRAAVPLIGLKTRTTMADAARDCSALWGSFAPYMEKLMALPQIPARGFSYGVSWVLDAGMAFEYWAAVEAPPSLPYELAGELLSAEIPAGFYAECRVSDIDSIHEAYGYIYCNWFPAAKRYAPLYSAPCYEFYRPDFLQTKALTLYCPVVEK